MSGFHLPEADSACTKREASSRGQQVTSRVSGILLLRTSCEADFRTMCVLSCEWMTASNELSTCGRDLHARRVAYVQLCGVRKKGSARPFSSSFIYRSDDYLASVFVKADVLGTTRVQVPLSEQKRGRGGGNQRQLGQLTTMCRCRKEADVAFTSYFGYPCCHLVFKVDVLGASRGSGPSGKTETRRAGRGGVEGSWVSSLPYVRVQQGVKLRAQVFLLLVSLVFFVP